MRRLNLFVKRVILALQRPDLVLRRLKVGKAQLSLISPQEIEYFTRTQTPIIIEAGASDGEDTLSFLHKWPKSTIYAFEPVPRALDLLRVRLHEYKQVEIIPGALAAVNGRRKMYVGFDESNMSGHGSSSLLEPSGHLSEFKNISFPKDLNIEVDCQNLDYWIKSKAIKKIDLLWLDLQGLEYEVLESSPRALEITSVIHLESSRQELYKGARDYSDLRKLLCKAGFIVAINRIGVITGNVLFVSRHCLQARERDLAE